MSEQDSAPSLSVVCVTGSRRSRLRRLLDDLASQTAVAQIEAIVVDAGPDDDPVAFPDRLRGQRIPYPSGGTLGDARAAGARAASGEAVAFLFDHCYPEPGWAQALIRAYRQPWAAIGYSFRNANPTSYGSRATMLAQFGPWMDPLPGGPTESLPGNMVSYRLAELRSLNGDLGSLLDVDHVLLGRLRSRGGRFAVAGDAVASEECYGSVVKAGRANLTYLELLAARRMREEGWRWPRRLAYAVATPVVAPLLRVAAVLRGAMRRPGMRASVLVHLPGIVVIAVMAGIGEARGYLTGASGAKERFYHFELDDARA